MLYGEVIEKIENKLGGIGRALDETDRAALEKILRKWDEAGAVSLQNDENGATLRFGTAKGSASVSAKDDWLDAYSIFSKRGGGYAAGTPENPVSHVFRLAAGGGRITKDAPEFSKADAVKAAIYKKSALYGLGSMDSAGAGAASLQLDDFLSPASYQAAGEKIFNRMQSYFETINPADTLFSQDKNEKAQACRKDIVAVLADFEKRRLQGSVLKFLAGVDREIRKTLHAAGLGSAAAMEWLNAGGDPQRQKYRHQAVRAYPALAPLFVGGAATKSALLDRFSDLIGFGIDDDRMPVKPKVATSVAPVASIKELQAVIDEGKPLMAFLQSYGLPGDVGPFSKTTLKTLSTIKRLPHSLNHEDLKRLTHLNDVPASWHPVRGKTLMAFMETVRIAEEFHKLTGRPVKDILNHTRGRWLEWNKKMGAPEELKILDEWLKEVSNVIVQPRQFAVAPALVERKKSLIEEQAVLFIGGGKYKKELGLAENIRRVLTGPAAETEIMACARKWHEQREGYNARKELMRGKFTPQEEAAIENESWLPLAEPMQAPNGLWIRSLTSMTEFKETGRALDICVGDGPSYALKCLTKPHHVVCLSQDPEGLKKLSTAELVELDGDQGTYLGRRQHQKYGKYMADAQQAEALEWYINTVKPDYSSIAAARDERCRRLLRNQVASEIGFDAQDPESCLKAWELIRPYLPHFLHHMAYEDLPVKAGIDDAIRESLTQKGREAAGEVKEMQAYERDYIERYIMHHGLGQHEAGHVGMAEFGARAMGRHFPPARIFNALEAGHEAQHEPLDPNREFHVPVVMGNHDPIIPEAGAGGWAEAHNRFLEQFREAIEDGPRNLIIFDEVHNALNHEAVVDGAANGGLVARDFVEMPAHLIDDGGQVPDALGRFEEVLQEHPDNHDNAAQALPGAADAAPQPGP